MRNSAWTSITLGKKSQENSTAGRSSARAHEMIPSVYFHYVWAAALYINISFLIRSCFFFISHFPCRFFFFFTWWGVVKNVSLFREMWICCFMMSSLMRKIIWKYTKLYLQVLHLFSEVNGGVWFCCSIAWMHTSPCFDKMPPFPVRAYCLYLGLSS